MLILEYIGFHTRLSRYRRKRQVRHVDPEKSRIAKLRWKTYRRNMMRGISKYHKSSAGKRFHRSLGKFNSKLVARQKERGDRFRWRKEEELIPTLRSLTI